MSTGKGSSVTIITRQPWTLYPPEADLPLTLHYQRDGRMTARHNCTSTVSLSITQMTEKTAGDRAGQSARGLFLRGPWKRFACVPVTEQLATGPAERKKKKKKKEKEKRVWALPGVLMRTAQKTITGSVTLSDIWKCCRSWGARRWRLIRRSQMGTIW